MPPLVSVIVPNYNHASYLRQRINSILKQNFTNIELILLDDHSTDDSQIILETYSREHHQVSHYSVNEKNSGSPFKQWQKGIALAQGKYIWIAESDDWCEPQLLETLIPHLEDYPDCSVGIVQSYCIKELGKIAWQSYHRRLEDKMDGKEYIRNYLTEGNSIFNASMAVFRKDAYERISNEFTGFKLCGDWYFWIQLLLQGNIFVSGKLLNYFRKHDQDVSGKAYATGLNFIEEIKILQLLKNENLINQQEFVHYLRGIYRNFSWRRNSLDKTIAQQADHEFLNSTQSFYERSLLWKDGVTVSARKNIHQVKQAVKSII